MRGRKRKDAGSRGGKVVTVTTYLDEAFVDELDVLADKIGIPRSQMVRNLTMMAFEDVKILDAFGLFTLIRKIEDMRKDFHGSRERLQPA